MVGVSFGGDDRSACRGDRTIPCRPRSLLIGTAVKIGSPQKLGRAPSQPVQQSGIKSVADGVMQRWFTPLFREQRPADWVGWRNMMVRTPAHGYAGTCAAIRDADLTEGAARISVPTLCIAGDQDGSTPPELVRQTADLIPRAGFEIIEGAGHIPGIEQPDATAESSNSNFGRQDMSEKERSERYKTGMIVRRKVLGNAHVDRASAQVTDLDADFQALITETAWGSVWSRPISRSASVPS